MRRAICAALLGALIGCGSPDAVPSPATPSGGTMPSTGAADQALAAFAARFLDEYLAKNPTRATEVGEETTALVKHLKGLQDILGELHDAHVLSEELASAQI